MEDRETPVLYLEMTEATPDDYAEEPVGDVRALPGRRARHLVAQRLPRPARPASASCPSSTPSACTSATPSFVPPVDARRDRRAPLPAHAAPGQGRLTGKPTVSLSLVLISPTTSDRGAGAARLGRLRAPQPHRRGRRPGLHDDHALRERHRRRPALPALLRVRRSRRRGHVQADAADASRRGSARGTRRSARRGRCTRRCASCTSTRSSSSARPERPLEVGQPGLPGQLTVQPGEHLGRGVGPERGGDTAVGRHGRPRARPDWCAAVRSSTSASGLLPIRYSNVSTRRCRIHGTTMSCRRNRSSAGPRSGAGPSPATPS